MNKRKVLLFLTFAFGISWLSAAVQYLCGVTYGSMPSVVLTALTYMTGPGLAAIIVQRFIYKESLFDYGFRLRKTNRKGWLLIPVIYFAFALFALGIGWLLGNKLQLPGFGEVDMDITRLSGKIGEIAQQQGVQSSSAQMLSSVFSSGWPLLFIGLAGNLIGAVINMPFTLGEELGWRGCMAYETRKLGFWKSNLFIGAAWGLWHAPIILQGHNYPGHGVAGVGMMVLFCMACALVMGYVRAKCKDVLAPTYLHALINASGGLLPLYVYNSNPLFDSMAGVAGIVGLLLIVAVLFLLDRKTFRQYETRFEQ